VVEGVVDFHTHIGEVRSFSRVVKGWVRAGPEDLLEYMDAEGVDWAVVLSCPSCYDPFTRIVSNEDLLRVARQCGGRLVPFCFVDPHCSGARERLRELVEEGARGLGEVKVPLRISDPRLVELLRAAEELGLPALIHVEEGPMFRYCYGLAELADVLKQLPDLKLVVHGPGWWSALSPKPSAELYPTGRVEGEGLVHHLLRRFDNLYADISAKSGLNALERDPEHARRFLEEFEDRVVYGTDFPCMGDEGQFGPSRAHLNLLSRLGLPERTLRKVLRENAERLLRRA